MEALTQSTVVRILCGISSEDNTYHRLTFFDSGAVRIERPYCLLDSHREVQPLEDTARRYKWLVWDLEEHQTEQWV
ncbi:hypothetical protein GCM10023189_57090 [Nibrella saemangeumensis]|uniref:WYL domain-containing protein n=1 Tax=Nibrella saemangeumensis TaxID=1084526 RepID=A0ABP8NRK9_9BACT